MPKFKGTPGPWEYRPDVVNKGYYIETVDQSHKNTFIGEAGGGLQQMDEIRNNAKLIAAAPELLEALQYAKRFLDKDRVDVNYIETVINKALGV